MIFRDKLIAVIRSGMDQEVHRIELSPEDCDELIRIGKRQSIQPIIHRGIERMSISSDCLRQFDRARLTNVKKHIRSNEALRRIAVVLDGESIPYIPLKGAVLQYLYPEPSLRTSSDIDVLVRETDLDRAVHSIEKNTDFEFDFHNYHDVRMIRPGIILELHFSIMEKMENIDKILSRAWDYAEPTGEYFRYAFSAEFQVFHVIAHMSYHMVHGGLGIRPFLDLWLLRNKTEFDEEIVRQMCDECGILMFYEKSCQLVDAWMDGNPIPKELSLVEEYCMNGGVFGNAQSVTASKLRDHRKSDYLLGRIFVKRGILEEEYPTLKEKPYLLPVCHINRWMRLLDKKKLSKAISEINEIRNAKEEKLTSFDAMLKELGL